MSISATHQSTMDDFTNLYNKMWECKRNVMWKDGAAFFVTNGVRECLKMSRQIQEKGYQPKSANTFQLKGPKRRTAVGISFRDRVPQRVLNDLYIFPQATRSLIYDNSACQKGKGADFARNRLECFLQKFYRQHGIDGWVLRCDVKDYYGSMQKKDIAEIFATRLDEPTYKEAMHILGTQYPGEKGLYPGSQLAQCVGIVFLDDLDHLIKEKLRVKYYLRYMDDFILIHHDHTFLDHCEREISKFLARRSMELHPTKTVITPISDGIPFLGFNFVLTETGKVRKFVKKESAKREKAKIRHMAYRVRAGRMDEESAREGYDSWRAFAAKGDSRKLLTDMDRYFDKYFCDIIDT